MCEGTCRVYLVNLEKKLFKLYKVKNRIQVVYTRENKKKTWRSLTVSFANNF